MEKETLMVKLVVLILTTLVGLTAYAEVCLEAGEVNYVADQPKGRFPTLNENGTQLFLIANDGQSFWFVDKNGKKSQTFEKEELESLTWLKDGTVLVRNAIFADPTDSPIKIQDHVNNSKMTIVNPKTGERKEITNKIFDRDSESFLTLVNIKNNRVTTFEKANGERFEVDYELYNPYSSNDERLLYNWTKNFPFSVHVNYSTGNLIIRKIDKKVAEIKLADGKVSSFTWPDTFFVSPDKNFLIFSSTVGSSLYVYNIAKQTLKTINPPYAAFIDGFAHNPDWLFYRSNDELLALNYKTDEKKIIKKNAGTNFHNVVVDKSGDYCLTTIIDRQKETRKDLYTCYNFKGETTKHFPLPIGTHLDHDNIREISSNHYLLHSSRLVDNDYINKFLFYKPKKICKNLLSIEPCKCEVPTNSPISVSDFSKILLKSACAKDFNESDWKALVDRTSKKIKEEDIPLWLLKFSKPGSFNVENDLAVFLTLIESQANVKYPSEFKAALIGVLTTAPVLYDELHNRYPKIKELKSEADSSCLTLNEKEKIKERLTANVEIKMEFKRGMKSSEMDGLMNSFKPYLNTKEKEELSAKIAEKVVENMQSDFELQDIFPSKIYKFALNKNKKNLGLPYRDLTDLTVVKNQEEISFYQLGMEPFDNSNERSGGIHLNRVKSVEIKNISKNETFKIPWKYGNKSYEASVDLKKDLVSKDIAPKKTSPNYPEMWKEGIFRGLIIVGANMETNVAADVVRDYIEYYSKEGFSFGKPESNENLPQYLKARISGAEPIHYFIKEAHSDGDEKNLFRINKTGKILRGIKTLKDKKEIIDIVYPLDGKDESELIFNVEFGEWVRQREKNNQPEFLYVNSSCWSDKKAVYEVSEARSAKMVNLPTISMMTVFTNENSNVLRSVVDGIRKQQTYAAIRNNMEKDPEYKEGTDNIMIFPDEDRYQTKIRDIVDTGVSIDTKVFVEKEKGKKVPYSIEGE